MTESGDSFNINTFSFSSWIEETYPCEDDTNAKNNLIQLLTSYFEGNTVFYSTRQTLVDLLDLISLLNSTEDRSASLMQQACVTLDNLKDQWYSVSRDQFMTVFNGYSLNVSALPVSVQFWKHLLKNRIVTQTRRMTRASLENEFILFLGRDCTLKFSHVLFCLSWLNLLRVYNNTTITINSRNSIAFH